MRAILTGAAILLVFPGPAVAQESRGLTDCTRVAASQKAECEARNVALTHCRLEPNDERFAACVKATLQNPPPLRTPGFSTQTTPQKPPSK